MTIEKLKGKAFDFAWWINIFCLLVVLSVIAHYHISQFDSGFVQLISVLKEISKDPFAVISGGNATSPNDFLIQ